MNVSYKKRFLKQLAKLPTHHRAEIEDFVSEALRREIYRQFP